MRCWISLHVKNAENGGYAVGAFNVYNLEGVEAVVAAAEEEQSPAILQVWSSYFIYYPSPHPMVIHLLACWMETLIFYTRETSDVSSLHTIHNYIVLSRLVHTVISAVPGKFETLLQTKPIHLLVCFISRHGAQLCCAFQTDSHSEIRKNCSKQIPELTRILERAQRD